MIYTIKHSAYHQIKSTTAHARVLVRILRSAGNSLFDVIFTFPSIFRSRRTRQHGCRSSNLRLQCGVYDWSILLHQARQLTAGLCPSIRDENKAVSCTKILYNNIQSLQYLQQRKPTKETMASDTMVAFKYNRPAVCMAESCNSNAGKFIVYTVTSKTSRP